MVIAAGLTHFVAAALPKSPIYALNLGDRNFITGVTREIPARLRCTRSFNAAAPPVRSGGVFSSQGRALFFKYEKQNA